MTVSQHRDRHVLSWRFLAPLAVQVLCVLMIPAQSIYAHRVGTSVVLQTAPVDPYNLLQGYYVVLNYNISQSTTLQELPGWDDIEEQSATDSTEQTDSSIQETQIYVVLEQPNPEFSMEDVDSAMPIPWKPVRVMMTRPAILPDTQVVIEGTYYPGSRRIIYGLEQYFIPEAQRDEINDRIRRAQQSGDRQSYVVEVKVTPQGTSTPVKLWIDGENYRF